MKPTTRVRRSWDVVVLAIVAWLPTFASHPGDVAADTKQFLYLDPAWLLGRTVSLWDESAGLGTVTHQNIGYLWPMGPWFWLCDRVGLPTWVAQRLWLGAIVFVAGLGIRHLLRRFDLRSTGAVLVASLAYALTPYQLAYLGRTSVLLLPWAGLPWLISLAIDAGRTGRWRAPALFALAVVTIGAVNASSLVYVGIGPLLWFPFAIWISRELPWRRAVGAMLRIGACALPVNLWWIAGLRTQAAYGLPVLQLTESLETVAETTSAAEIMRGLGYWYFYGKDGAQPWTASVRWYTQRLWLIIASFALPALAVAAGLLTRWRYRTYFVLLTLVGLLLSVGVHPYDDPSPFGAVIKEASLQGSAAFALRNSPRAVPLLALGLAGCIAIGLSALAARFPRPAPIAGVARRRSFAPASAVMAAMAVLVVVCFPPAWTLDMVQPQLKRPEDLPDYWTEAIADLDAEGSATRVLELPGQDFGAYRWGFTQDVITRGLMDRTWAGRELIPFGSPSSADLLRALDHRLQEGIWNAEALAPVARLMGAGDVVLRTDAQYERFRTPRPRLLWDSFTNDPPPGVTLRDTYGDAVPNVAIATQPLLDEVEQSTPVGAPWAPPVAVYAVDDPTAIVRATTAERPMILSGDGEGLVDAAEAGLLTRDQLIRYSGHLSASELDAAIAAGADVVVTDTNRRRAQRWGTLRENFGYTEQAGESALVLDPKDTRLAMFPDATDDAYSVTQWDGPVRSVQASDYGNPVSYTPEDRPTNALDGSLRTAWKVGAFDEVRGEYLRVELESAIELSSLTVWQPQGFIDNRWITRLTVRFSDGSSESYALDDSSRGADGQVLTFSSRVVGWVDLVVDDTNLPKLPSYPGVSPVGFAEVAFGDPGDGAYRFGEDPLVVDETVRLPIDALSAPSAAGTDHRLAIVMSRLRSNPAEPFRADPEPRLDRTVTLPVAREFTAVVDLRLDPKSSDAALDALLRTDDGNVRAVSSDRIAGQLGARGSSAFDGDPATAWIPGYGDQRGRWVQVTADASTTLDHFDLTVVADGRHSVPRKILLYADDAAPVEVVVPEIADEATEGHTATVRVELPAPITFTTLRVEIAEVRANRTIDFYSEGPVDLPVAISELDLGDLQVGSRAATVFVNASLEVEALPVALVAEADAAELEAGGTVSAQALLPLGSGTNRLIDWSQSYDPGQGGWFMYDPACEPDADGTVMCPDLAAIAGSGAAFASSVCDGAPEMVTVEPGARLCDRPIEALLGGRRPAGQSAIVDRVVLLSDVGGGAAMIDSDTGVWAPAPVSPTPTVTVTEDGLHSATVEITEAAEPFWLVFGQSDSDGWHARLDGEDLGPSEIVDGYANGWLIDPAGRTSFTVEIDWTPQQLVDRAVGLSAVSLVVLVGVAWRNPRRGAVSIVPAGATEPQVRLAAGARRPAAREVAVWSLVCAVVGGLFAGVAGALVVGLVALAALAWRRGRWLSATIPWAVFGPVGALIAALQWRRHYRPGVEWPNSFVHAHQVVLVAVLVIVADVISQWRRHKAPDSAVGSDR